ncbi:MAG: IclR family transcriptional regulator [Hydrogenophilaceae bacterium]|nr:IclR family transcriptional regulator [Hydrogenophilaceae bacterium]
MSNARLDKDEAGGPRAMSRVLKLLSVLAKAPEGLSLTDLAAALDTAKSTMLASLKPLAADDFLVVEGNLYRLGPRAFRLAAEISSAWSLPRTLRGYLRTLADRSGESVGLAVLDAEMRRSVYVDVIESARPVRYALKIGMSGPLHSTAAGRVLLAHQPEEYTQAFLKTGKLAAFTPRTTTDAKQLAAQLEQVRRDGYWLSIGESIEDSAAIAAPVFGPNGDILAALTIGAPSDRLQANLDALRAALLEVAAHASGRAEG